MAHTCCCRFGMKLCNACRSQWQRPLSILPPVYEAMVVLLTLAVGAHRAVAVPSQQTYTREAFQSFQFRPLAVEQQQQHHYSQSRWADLQTNGPRALQWSERGNGGGVAMPLVHRDARDSPFRVELNSQQGNGLADHKEADFATIFRNSLQRDVARVRAIDSLITKKAAARHLHSRRVHDVMPPIESPIFPGIQFGSGEYFTTLAIGTPAAQVLVTVDTGSDLFWVQCKPCDSCYDQINPVFDSAKSGSYRPLPCRSRACAALTDARCDARRCVYVETYGDQSFSTGELASETVTMNSTARDRPVEIQRLLFGCGHDNEGLFTASAGILGLGRGPLSFPTQMAGVLAPRFSYCLTDRFPANSTGANGSGSGSGAGGDGDDKTAVTATSYLFFGEAAEVQGMQYTTLLKNPLAPSFYYMQLTGLSVGNEVVEIPASALELDLASGKGGVILDTGTAVTRLSSDAYEAMRDAFRLKASHLTRVELPNQGFFDSCYQLEGGESLPSVTMHFVGDVDLALPLDNTVIPVDDSGSLYCLAFARSDVHGGLTIIGNIQQQGFRFEFDLAKNRAGFTSQGCSTN